MLMYSAWIPVLGMYKVPGIPQPCLSIPASSPSSPLQLALGCAWLSVCRACLLLATNHPTKPGPHTLWHMLHRLRAAAPQLEVHLFRAAADKQLCSSDSSSRGPYDPNKGRHATMHADSVAHISAYVSEVSRPVGRAAAD
jgi:hypothetical protein